MAMGMVDAPRLNQGDVMVPTGLSIYAAKDSALLLWCDFMHARWAHKDHLKTNNLEAHHVFVIQNSHAGQDGWDPTPIDRQAFSIQHGSNEKGGRWLYLFCDGEFQIFFTTSSVISPSYLAILSCSSNHNSKRTPVPTTTHTRLTPTVSRRRSVPSTCLLEEWTLNS